MDRASIPEPVTVFRGAALRPESSSILVQGATFSDAGFTSTSLRATVAEDFTLGTPGRERVFFRLTLPKGTRATALVSNKSEAEVLVDRGMRFKITKVELKQRGPRFTPFDKVVHAVAIPEPRSKR